MPDGRLDGTMKRQKDKNKKRRKGWHRGGIEAHHSKKALQRLEQAEKEAQ